MEEMDEILKKPIPPDDIDEMSECFDEIKKAMDDIKDKYDSLNYKSARTLADMLYWYEIVDFDLAKFIEIKMMAINIFIKKMENSKKDE